MRPKTILIYHCHECNSDVFQDRETHLGKSARCICDNTNLEYIGSKHEI